MVNRKKRYDSKAEREKLGRAYQQPRQCNTHQHRALRQDKEIRRTPVILAAAHGAHGGWMLLLSWLTARPWKL
jgi:hypothetical protein